ncbi:N-carbamoylsarcosine amidase [Hartmannibacter diazotrophicus]|uniref:N-carbamoylsarcosine amidase n=1 Tax=Hartmannibacter diazotrophicus TaxID=1482074 RepID=A0A2C9D1E2_9HYPH|nr:isochorismatase family protein [Hartmannibacter diazotrophicus]SON54054.1 N-carbamoylsarcosine amidase [Hartmannibacter diazotrophicus]
MNAFEDHCWKDVVSADVLHLYRHYSRAVKVGPRPALLLIDLYNLVYAGGPRPIAEVADAYPSSCGIEAWNAIPPTVRLIAEARRSGLPVFYSTGVPRAGVKATLRTGSEAAAGDFDIHDAFAPEDDDTIIAKERASVFFGTLFTVHLARLGIQSVIIAGESTSGCVRASVVDAYSHGYHVTVAEDCCFDRSPLSHKIGLFDMHHKYADVMTSAEIVDHLSAMR